MKNKIIYIITLGILIAFISCSTTKNIEDKSYNNEVLNPKINQDNYYNYHSSNFISTGWLRYNDAIPIIINEFRNAGYLTETKILYELSNGNRIIIDVYDRVNNIGVVFNTGHFAEVKKEHRNLKNFTQRRFKHSGGYGKWEKHNDLPNNILVLQETWYWYQKVKDNSNGNELNKTTIKEILRQNIRTFLSEMKK